MFPGDGRAAGMVPPWAPLASTSGCPGSTCPGVALSSRRPCTSEEPGHPSGRAGACVEVPAGELLGSDFRPRGSGKCPGIGIATMEREQWPHILFAEKSNLRDETHFRAAGSLLRVRPVRGPCARAEGELRQVDRRTSLKSQRGVLGTSLSLSHALLGLQPRCGCRMLFACDLVTSAPK